MTLRGTWAGPRSLVMTKFILPLGLGVVVAFVLAADHNPASAHGGQGSPHVAHSSPHTAFRSMHTGGRASHSHFYRSSYRGWSSYCWFPRYRCYGYYCPTASCWYYWYPQYNCYMPC